MTDEESDHRGWKMNMNINKINPNRTETSLFEEHLEKVKFAFDWGLLQIINQKGVCSPSS